MRCKLHPYANAVGVCAPCLRDRLLALAAERAAHADDCAAADDASSPRSSLHPPARGHRQQGFPRSVSPYVAHRRRSDACASYASSGAAHQHSSSLLFFRTPQVGPTARADDDDDEHAEEEEEHRKVAEEEDDAVLPSRDLRLRPRAAS
ncbi:hypothetical protein PR202_ga07897 [Eleusine coracana subsp. coracana]|uniref:Uncharacterized protein n=1 Tax=Eleusine coracana subsp. coracana TaxID=191504 RepID=A0AAV5C0S8_ELECO|nr:hypothetical protein PR202_ga07897 [Eleusine coracana subsp. coracana]